MQRNFQLIAACVVLLSITAAYAKRPNIVFIFTDDHAAHAISAYGSKVNKTPNIDRIANAGMRFDNCLVTNSICGPSRACILTGKYSHVNGFYRNGNRFDGEQWNFAKSLQKAGYQTAMIGKWHLSSDPTGFDYWEVLYGQGPYYNPPMKKNGERVTYTGYTTEIITDRTLDWLKNIRDKNKPFMLMFQHKAPHRNWQPGPKYLTMYDDVTIPEAETLWDDYSGRTRAAKNQAMTISRHLNANDLKLRPPGNLTKEQLAKWNAAYEPKNEAYRKAKEAGELTDKQDTQWKYQRYMKDYLRCVAAVDDNIGRIQKYLKDTGLDENTIVIYSSDQGWYLGDHGWYDKRWMYEESLKMPFVIQWPGVIEPGSVNKDIISNVDFAATFLDIAGAKNPGDLHGRSIVPLLKGKTPADWRKSFYYHYYEFPGAHSVAKHYGVRTDRYKLIHFYQNKEWELFDLQKDPNELKSVYDDPSYAKIRGDLEKELTRLQQVLGETEPHKPVPGDPGTRGKRPKQFKKGKKKAFFQAGQDKALSFNAKPQTPSNRPDPAARPLAIGAWINPASDTGVVVAQGGASYGYALHLNKGLPTFSVRNMDQLAEVKGKNALSTKAWVHVLGVLDGDQKLRLYIDGEQVAEAKGHAIDQSPADGLTVGGDAGSIVGDYAENNHFKGDIRDLRCYVGVLSEKDIKAWASR